MSWIRKFLVFWMIHTFINRKFIKITIDNNHVSTKVQTNIDPRDETSTSSGINLVKRLTSFLFALFRFISFRFVLFRSVIISFCTLLYRYPTMGLLKHWITSYMFFEKQNADGLIKITRLQLNNVMVIYLKSDIKRFHMTLKCLRLNNFLEGSFGWHGRFGFVVRCFLKINCCLCTVKKCQFSFELATKRS